MPILVLEHENQQKQNPSIKLQNALNLDPQISNHTRISASSNHHNNNHYKKHRNKKHSSYNVKKINMPSDGVWGVNLAAIAKFKNPSVSLGLAVVSVRGKTSNDNGIENDNNNHDDVQDGTEIALACLKEGDLILRINNDALYNVHVKDVKKLFLNARSKTLGTEDVSQLTILRMDDDGNGNGTSQNYNSLDEFLNRVDDEQKEYLVDNSKQQEMADPVRSAVDHDDDVSSVTNPSIKIGEGEDTGNLKEEERDIPDMLPDKIPKKADILSILKRQALDGGSEDDKQHSLSTQDQKMLKHSYSKSKWKNTTRSHHKTNVESLYDKLLGRSDNIPSTTIAVSSRHALKSQKEVDHKQVKRINTNERKSVVAGTKRKRISEYNQIISPTKEYKRAVKSQPAKKQKKESIDPKRELVTDRDRRRISDYLSFLLSQYLRFECLAAGGNDLSNTGGFDNRRFMAQIVCRHCESSRKPFFYTPSSSRNLGSGFKKTAFQHLMSCGSCDSKVRAKLVKLEGLQTQQWVNCKPTAEFSFYDRVWSRINELEEIYSSSDDDDEDEDEDS